METFDGVVSFDMLLGREREGRLGKAMKAASLRLGVRKPPFWASGPFNNMWKSFLLIACTVCEHLPKTGRYFFQLPDLYARVGSAISTFPKVLY